MFSGKYELHEIYLLCPSFSSNRSSSKDLLWKNASYISTKYPTTPQLSFDPFEEVINLSHVSRSSSKDLPNEIKPNNYQTNKDRNLSIFPPLARSIPLIVIRVLVLIIISVIITTPLLLFLLWPISTVSGWWGGRWRGIGICTLIVSFSCQWVIQHIVCIWNCSKRLNCIVQAAFVGV